MSNSLDLIYFIVGVGLIVTIANMVLSTLNKDNYSNLVNLAGTSIVMLRIIALIYELFQSAEVFLRL